MSDSQDSKEEPLLDKQEFAHIQVGRFLQSWAMLESKVNRAIETLLSLGSLEAIIVNANLNFRAKLHIVKTAVNLKATASTEWKVEAGKSIDAIGNLSADRNIVAHEMFFAIGGSKKKVEFARYQARGKLNFPETIWAESDFDDKIERMENLSERIVKIVEAVVPKKPATLAEIVGIGSLSWKQGISSDLSHLFQPSPDFQPANLEIDNGYDPKREDLEA